MSWDDVRKAIVEACQRLDAGGLVAGSSGNVSVRLPASEGEERELVAVTPTRILYRELRPDQVLVIDYEGDPVDGDGVPSSETLVHLAAYRARPDVGAAIHTHSLYASALAVAGEEIPAVIDEQVVFLGGSVPVAEYGMAGTEELAEKAVAALGRRQAVLLSNHGTLGVGADLEEALAVVELVERIAKVYTLARLIGQARPLPDSVIETEQKIFRMQRGFPQEE